MLFAVAATAAVVIYATHRFVSSSRNVRAQPLAVHRRKGTSRAGFLIHFIAYVSYMHTYLNYILYMGDVHKNVMRHGGNSGQGIGGSC